jgi:2-polyprenyl-3-methyl-5-hydroxy-6-metoxy-1,4-benzoquinol methylase
MSILGSLREMWHLFEHQPEIRVDRVDYDAYWEVKRDGNLGALNAYQADRVAWIARRVREGDAVLDLGCGDGAALLALRKAARVEAFAADVALKPLDYLSKQGVRTVVCNLSRMEEVARLPACDHVLLLEVLEHFGDAEQLLQTALGRARQSVFFSVPNTGYLPYRMRLLFGRCPVQWRTHPGEHLRFWTMSDLRWWLGQLGLLHRAEVSAYQGFPILNQFAPSLFASALIVRIEVREVS